LAFYQKLYLPHVTLVQRSLRRFAFALFEGDVADERFRARAFASRAARIALRSARNVVVERKAKTKE
jgi:hypothetical protein